MHVAWKLLYNQPFIRNQGRLPCCLVMAGKASLYYVLDGVQDQMAQEE